MQAHPLMVASLSSSWHHQVQWLKWVQVTLHLRIIHKEAVLHRNPMVVMIIHHIVTHLRTAMVAHINVEMVLTITVMEATVEIKIGMLIETFLVGTTTCNHREVLLGLLGPRHHHL